MLSSRAQTAPLSMEVDVRVTAAAGRRLYALVSLDGSQALERRGRFDEGTVEAEVLAAEQPVRLARRRRCRRRAPSRSASDDRREGRRQGRAERCRGPGQHHRRRLHDYLTKPFSAGELLARIRAFVRRAAALTSPPVVVAGELEIDIARRRITLAGNVVALTPTEFDILAFLARNADLVVTQRMILENVWGPEWVEDAQTLRVHVSNLRKKIEPSLAGPRCIITGPGVGFCLSAPKQMKVGNRNPR
jgi:DNA-binding winged helix-turn-helix (wHTH) protein